MSVRLAVAMLVTLFAAGATFVGGGGEVVGPSPSVALVETTGQSVTPVEVPSPAADLAGVADTPATRGTAVRVADTLPPPTTTPQGIPGNCDSWIPVFAAAGGTADEIAFFVPAIIRRETTCGLDTLNESTGDSGICQINPIHNRPGWFGGREFGDGGWLLALHGLRTRVDTASPRWADACLTLYRVCGSGAWRPPYSCDNRRLP